MLAFLFYHWILSKKVLLRFGFFLLGLFFSLLGIAFALLTHVWLLAVFVVAIAIMPLISRSFLTSELDWTGGLAPFSVLISRLLEEYAAYFLGVFLAFLV